MKDIIVNDKIKCYSYKKEELILIGSGGYGGIFKTDNDMIIKSTWLDDLRDPDEENNCLNGKGCSRDNPLMEGLILSILNKFNLCSIPKFYGLYTCDNTYKLFMEYVKGKNLEDFAPNNDIIKLTILFQITYTLYHINKFVKFIHGDLYNGNIIISNVPHETYPVEINGETFNVNNNGIKVTLIDFGDSQLSSNDVTLVTSYADKDNLFNQAIDICRLYNNPHLKLNSFKTCIIDGLKDGLKDGVKVKDEVTLDNILKECVSDGYIYLPPFPSIKYIDILTSSLFDELKEEYSFNPLCNLL